VPLIWCDELGRRDIPGRTGHFERRHLHGEIGEKCHPKLAVQVGTHVALEILRSQAHDTGAWVHRDRIGPMCHDRRRSLDTDWATSDNNASLLNGLAK
jgi:hypothetical protein